MRAPDVGIFAGDLINRGRPIKFVANGKNYVGMAGDTILSALLANGVSSAGKHLGHPIALTERIQPAFYLDYADADPIALPASRTCIWEGARFSTRKTGHRNLGSAIGRLLGKRATDLGCDFSDSAQHIFRPDSAGSNETQKVDVVIVGGGVAGMAAARDLGEAGKHVVLVERAMRLGGDYQLFGASEGEPDAQTLTQELEDAIAKLDNVQVLLGAEAFDAYNRTIAVHHVIQQDEKTSTQITKYTCQHIILATGMADRLPVFPGNGQPGVVRLVEAFHLAQDYGVWTQGDTHISGSTSAIYRFGILAKEAAQAVSRISDFRLEPHSRFRDFAKAHGLQLSQGQVITSAHLGGADGGLEIAFSTVWDEPGQGIQELLTDRLIVSDGWIQRLRLWSALSGKMIWPNTNQGFVAGSGPKHVHLAGSVTGLRSIGACQASGHAAALAALGRRTKATIKDPAFDPAFESLDGDRARAETDDEFPAYLTGSRTLATSVQPQRSGLFGAAKVEHAKHMHLAGRRLTLEDIATMVHIGDVAGADAGLFSQERNFRPIHIRATQNTSPNPNAPVNTPNLNFLEGRITKPLKTCLIQGDAQRAFEPGAFVFPSSDHDDVAKAIGVVIGQEGTQSRVRLSAGFAIVGERVSVFEGNRHHGAVINA